MEEYRIYNDLTYQEKAKLKQKGISESKYNYLNLQMFLIGANNAVHSEDTDGSAEVEGAYQALYRILFDTDQIEPDISALLLKNVSEDLTFFDLTNKVRFPLDPVNRKIWRECPGFDNNGRYGDFIPTGKNKKDVERAGVDVVLKWDNEDVVPQFPTIFDEILCGVVSKIYEDAKTDRVPIPFSLIYRNMGGKGNPNNKQLNMIEESINRMNSIRIWYSNYSEIDRGTSKVPIKIDTRMLQVSIYTMKYHGNSAKVAVILEYPAPFQFAKAHRKRIATIPVEVMKIDWKRSPDSQKIFNYLLGYILWRGSEPKMLYETIRDKCNIPEKNFKKHKTDYLKIIVKFMEHFVKCHWGIESFKAKKEGVEFTRLGSEISGKGSEKSGKGSEISDNGFLKCNAGKGLRTPKKPCTSCTT